MKINYFKIKYPTILYQLIISNNSNYLHFFKLYLKYGEICSDCGFSIKICECVDESKSKTKNVIEEFFNIIAYIFSPKLIIRLLIEYSNFTPYYQNQMSAEDFKKIQNNLKKLYLQLTNEQIEFALNQLEK